VIVATPTGLCSAWITADDLSDEMFGDLDADSVDDVCMFASEVLYVLANRYWPGVCTRTVRPDLGVRNLWWSTEPGGGAWTDARWPGWWGQTPYGWDGPRRWGVCDQANRRFSLPGPVQSVDSIVIDGTTLPPSAYFVDGRSTLVRVDGDAWPTGQDLTRSPTATGSGAHPAWQVTYQWGEDPPRSGVIACKSLTSEVLAALTGCAECRLPWAGAVASAQRKGTTVNYQSLSDQFKNGEVGLADVNLWLNTVRGGVWRPRRARIGRADARNRNQRVTSWS